MMKHVCPAGLLRKACLAGVVLALVLAGCESPTGGETDPGPTPEMTVAPKAPKNVKAVKTPGTDNSITVTWDGVEGAAYYAVSYSGPSGGSGQLAEGTATSYVHAPLVTGSYTYSVTAFNKYDFSGPSSSASLQINVPVKIPPAPANVEATYNHSSSSSGAITLTWEAAYQATDYKVLRSRGSSSVWELVASGLYGSTTIQDNGPFNPNETYLYKVSALNGEGESPYSAPASVVTAPPPVPEAPVISYSYVSGSHAYIFWDAVPEATSYQVFISDSPNGTYSLVTNTSVIRCSYSPGAGTHYFRVSAVNSAGESPRSEPVSVTLSY